MAVKRFVFWILLLLLLFAAALAEPARVITPGGPVNMRRGASAKAKLAGSVPNGALVKVTEIEGEWAKVTYKKQTGYVKTEFLLLSSALAGKTVYPDGGEAVAYTAPDAGTRILTVYGGGTPLAVTAVADGWAAVDCAGQTGYVPVSALSMQRETPGEETGFLPEAAVTVLDCTLTLTETEAETLPAGTEVTVCGLLADGLCRAETPLGWGALPRDALCLSPYPDEAVRLEGLPPTEAAALAETALKKAYQDFGKQRLYSVITLEGDSAYQCGFFSDADQHLYSAAVRADGRVTAVCAYTGFAAPQPARTVLLPEGQIELVLSADTLAVGDVLDITVSAWTAHQCRYILTGAAEARSDAKPRFAAAYRPRAAGDYLLTAEVTDENGRTERAEAAFTVTEAEENALLPVYSQKDGWWRDKRYRDSNLDKSGCAIFTLSHALQRMGRTGEELLPENLARAYALCLTDTGTNNERLIREAAADFGFTTRSQLISDEKKIRSLLQGGAMFSFSIARGHIALVCGLSEDGTMVQVVDSAPFATFDRIVDDSLYYRLRSGSFRAATALEDLPGSRWYFETDDYGGLEYWLRLSYVAGRGVRLIQP